MLPALLLPALLLLLLPHPSVAQSPSPSPSPSPISPSCMINGQPCPVPSPWAVDWSLQNSSACMPSLEGSTNNISFLPAHRWGLASLDWSVGRGSWLNTTDLNASTCEATSIANCRALKAAGLVHRCGIYHNLELSLQWIESNRAVMFSPSTSDWFLQFTDGKGNKNGTIYNQPRAEGSQFFIDWRNADAAAYFVAAIVNTTLQDGVDLTFTDDRDGIPVEHPTLPALLNLSAAEVQEIQFATQSAGQYLATSLAANGRTCWDCLAGENLGVRPTQSTCATVMRQLCDPGMQGRSMFMDTGGAFVDANQTVAAFLITRPPVAFVGDRFPTDASWNPLFALDVGEPDGGALCVESPAGVFSRAWTKGTPSLNCNTWTATLPFGVLEG
jgi:hypothetical protein